MIKSFAISEFKTFRHVVLDDLRRMNLIVGSNNAGKSCVLEAIRLWSSNGSPFVIRDLINAHDIDTVSFRRPRRLRYDESEPEDLLLDGEAEDPIRFLFHGFHYEPDTDITLGPQDPSETLSISLGRYTSERSDEGIVKRTKVGPSIFADFATDSEILLEIRNGRARTRLFPLDNLWTNRNLLRMSVSEDPPIQPVTVVGTGGVGAAQVTQLWDRISLTPDQDRVLDCLRLVEPRIDGLTLVSDHSSASQAQRIPVFSLRDRAGRFPLRTMGDGVTRIFHIALAMVNAKGGTVLIDEFENGIYWDVQARLWAVVYRMAKEFDVQVFATSHSTDCIRGFVDAAADFADDGAIFRVEKHFDSGVVSRIPVINASDALDARLEIR